MHQEYANEILKRSREGYDEIAQDFSRTRSGGFWEELSFVRDLIPSDAHLLDVGCGNGRFLEFLVRSPRTDLDGSEIEKGRSFMGSYIGLDFSKELIRIAEERNKNVGHASFVVGDALKLPFADHTFDATVSFAVIHHIPSEEYRKQFFRELARVTKPGGVVIVTAWNAWRPHFRSLAKIVLKQMFGLTKLECGDAFFNFGNRKNVRYVHAHSLRELRKLAESVGLTVKESRKVRRPSGEENFLLVLRA